MDDMEHSEFDAAFAKLAEGYREGTYEGRRFSLIVRRSGDGRRNSLFARELDGTDIVSFNLFRVTSDMKWFTEFGHLNRGDMLTSEQHRCHNEKKKFQRRV